jgi:3-phenylpropionate/trans-cinnamate dioxygenase ferredoxin reductase subunit
MEHFKYLIVGGGMTAAAAVEGIRSVDPAGAVGIISAEPSPPYNRPPLSKALWKGESVDTIWRTIDPRNVTSRLGRTALNIDLAQKQVVDAAKNIYSWEKLLLATGGSPRLLPFGNDRIIYYRTVEDYRRLRAATEMGKKFAVIGAGFIGTEIAAALALNGKEVVVLFPGAGLCDRVFPRDLSEFVSRYYEQKGVQLLSGTKVTGLEMRAGRVVLKTSAQREIQVDGVVAGLGIDPNIELASSAGLKTENGICVDELLRTSHPDIYAAGDVAAFYNPALEKRVRVEHEDNANTMGRIAGRNMAGASDPYHHLPMFYSDLFELGYEAVGELDSRLETFADWKQLNKEGVIYYLQNGRVRGVLLWNVWGQVDAARALIAERGQFRAENLKGRI